MNKRYQVSLTSFVFDSGVEFTTVFKTVVGASDNIEYAFRLAYHACKKSSDYETHDGETLQHVKITEGDKLVAMAKFMLRGEGPDTHYYLEWLQRPNAATVKEWNDDIARFELQSVGSDATEFTAEANQNRIVIIEDLLESRSLGPQRPMMKLIFQAEEYMGFPTTKIKRLGLQTTKVKRLEDELGL